MTLLLLLLLALAPVAAAAPPSRYKEGQVWAYHTRPGDEGSLLKIQRIEQAPSGTIYHLSVIGFRFHTPGYEGVLPHEPVSQQTLDNSVAELRPDPGTFPSADPGIAQWREAHGGVFTVTVAETLNFVDQTLASHAPVGG